MQRMRNARAVRRSGRCQRIEGPSELPCYDLRIMTRVCLDTVITSGRVLEDLPPGEMGAIKEIERLDREGLIKIVTTEVSRIEERRTTDPLKRARLEARWNEVSVVQPEPVLLGFNCQDFGARGFISSPLMSDIDEKLLTRLRTVGLAELDARAVVFAVTTNCDYFVTHDTNDLLPHKSAIEAVCPNIRVVKPTEFLQEWHARASTV
jgi:hypothetical protein